MHAGVSRNSDLCHNVLSESSLPTNVHSFCTPGNLYARRLLGEADHVLNPAVAADDTLKRNRLVQNVRIGGMCVPIMTGSWFAEAVEAL